MRGFRVLCAAFLFMLAACGGRTPLDHQRSSSVEAGGSSPDGAADSGGTGGIVKGTGGAGAGGSVGSGGRGGSGGVGGAGGSGGFGGIATGGRVASGGAITTSGRFATGGRIGTGGRIATGGTIETGGRIGTGGRVATGGAPGTGDRCGDGTIDPGEACDLGSGNLAAPAFWVTQAGQSFAATPLVRFVSSAEFYAYSSLSAHTGFEAAETSRIMLHLQASARSLALIFVHGVDETSTGQVQPESTVVMNFRGLPPTAIVDVGDESNELVMTPPTAATALWNFRNNSDGGSFSGLPFPGDWEITLEPTFVSGISIWTWVRSDGSFVNLDLTQPLIIKAYDIPSKCRPDCTIPRCGDGILDGGEFCDEGGQPINGCGSDCKSFD